MLDIVQEHGWKDPVKTKRLIPDWLNDNDYIVPAGELYIHSPESIKFMSEVVGADDFMLKIMREGLSLVFQLQPSSCYKEPNNQSV